jgi:hypothetical protein
VRRVRSQGREGEEALVQVLVLALVLATRAPLEAASSSVAVEAA